MQYLILVVDDEAELRDIIALDLQDAGYSTIEAGDGAEALAILEKGQVHAVVTDVRMPRLDGLQLTKEIRARGWTYPVLLITGYSDINATIALELGAQHMLEKPIDIGLLLHSLSGELAAREA